MNDQQLAEAKQKLGCDVLHFPTVLGADVPSHNIPGVTAALKFTPASISNIYLWERSRSGTIPPSRPRIPESTFPRRISW